MNTSQTSQMPGWAWTVFAISVIVLLAIDLIFARGKSGQSREALIGWAGAWIGAGILFGGFVWISFGAKPGHEYFAAWLMEESLSLDNLFVFLLIFGSLGIESEADQHRVLFWGILGAILLRGLFIFLGTAILERWSWVSFIFGALLLFAAWKAFSEDSVRREKSPVVRWLSRRLPVKTKSTHGRFIARKDGAWAVTPLMLALVAIELSDVIFAIDSVPAALSITHDRFIVYSSNIFAILGLRALYLLMAKTVTELRYLHYGLAAVLFFAAIKIMLSHWLVIPSLLAVGVIVAALATAILASVYSHDTASAPGP